MDPKLAKFLTGEIDNLRNELFKRVRDSRYQVVPYRILEACKKLVNSDETFDSYVKGLLDILQKLYLKNPTHSEDLRQSIEYFLQDIKREIRDELVYVIPISYGNTLLGTFDFIKNRGINEPLMGENELVKNFLVHLSRTIEYSEKERSDLSERINTNYREYLDSLPSAPPIQTQRSGISTPTPGGTSTPWKCPNCGHPSETHFPESPGILVCYVDNARCATPSAGPDPAQIPTKDSNREPITPKFDASVHTNVLKSFRLNLETVVKAREEITRNIESAQNESDFRILEAKLEKLEKAYENLSRYWDALIKRLDKN